ncbi:MAG: hypothetical protein QG568_582 [Patescibacteria group bacterium]|nr:hypothetical protein [Patescibacteria group bacterium]
MSLSVSISQEQSQDRQSRNAYIREALRAFRKVTVQGRSYYTCNVDRLKECNRLGDEKQVTTWRTHFFLRSKHFDGVCGVIFSSAPGRELADFSAEAVDTIYISMGVREILNPKNGNRIFLEEDLVFASDKKEEVK